MKHEYTADELAELKSIYDESGEAGLQIGEMRALRKAGLLTQGLPEKPSKRDCILAHCKKHLSQSQKGNVSASDVARTLRMPKSTVLYQMNNLLMLGMLDRHGHTWTLKTRKDAQ